LADKPSLEELRRIVEERKLTPCHAFFASFIASLAEAGILNQAVTNFMARHAATILHSYLKAMGMLKAEGGNSAERLESLVRRLNAALGIGNRVEFRRLNSRELLVGIGGEKCRYCPRAVGRAEIPGTACPFPRLIEALAHLEGVKATYKPIVVNGQPKALKREAGLCWIRYRLD
jgi:hypothetical protein